MWPFPNKPAAVAGVLSPSKVALDSLVREEGIARLNDVTGTYFPYLCKANRWTIGVGHVLLDANGRQLQGSADAAQAVAVYPHGLTMDQCIDLLKKDLAPLCSELNKALSGVATTQNEFDAMVSMGINIGTAGICSSTMMKLHVAGKKVGTHTTADAVSLYARQGQHPDNAADAFLMWVKDNGNVDESLVNRRVRERWLYSGAQ